MSDQEDVELDEQIANTVIKIGKWSFTPAKLMILVGVVSSILGGLYGTFEVYKDYQDMKEKIETYVAPDLSELHKRIELAEQNGAKSVEYTQDIKNDLKGDIRRVEGILETVERGSKQSQRDVDLTVKSLNAQMNSLEKETATELRSIRREVDDKIKKALDNPLSN